MKKKREPKPKQPKLKSVNYKIIHPIDGNHEPEPYKILREVRAMHHGDTTQARVALAWRLRDKPDKDGHIVLGKCVKCSDLSREFADWDFIIVLNETVWNDIEFDKKKKIALVDHEMMHIAPDYDEETGEHKQDERGRFLFRVRKHSIEEFTEIVGRHGCYKSDLEQFARTLLRNREPSLFPPEQVAKTKSGAKDLAAFHDQQIN